MSFRFEFAQHSPTIRPSVERTAEKGATWNEQRFDTEFLQPCLPWQPSELPPCRQGAGSGDSGSHQGRMMFVEHKFTIPIGCNNIKCDLIPRARAVLNTQHYSSLARRVGPGGDSRLARERRILARMPRRHTHRVQITQIRRPMYHSRPACTKQ